MARRPRLFGEKLYHHIYAWGNNRHAIFISDQHYAKYLEFLEKYSTNYKVDIIAYALMRSHIHLFVCDVLGKVSLFMNCLHGEYAQYFNRVTGRVGHVFGERFNNKVVQANEYGLWLSRYIHRQAVEAELVVDCSAYRWTSYRVYLGEATRSFLKPDVVLEQFGSGDDRTRQYREFVEGAKNGPVDWDLRSITVVGDEEFKKEVHDCETTKEKEDLCDIEIHELIAARFKIEPGLLVTPHGWKEKRLRHRIVRYLIAEVGLKPTRIVKICHMSRMAVQKALMKK